jgi:glycosyltransferase 2 family protein
MMPEPVETKPLPGDEESHPARTNSRKKILFGIIRWAGTLVSMGLFIWLISRQDWEQILVKATGIPLWIVLLVLILYLSSFGFNTLRWCILLWAQDVRVNFWQAFRMTWAGSFASNFLPSTIGGDGLRMVGIFRYTNRKTVAIGSVILDRIINMAAMICLLPALPFTLGSSLMPFLYGFSGGIASTAALVIPAGLKNLFARYFPKVMNAFQDWASRPGTFVYAFLAAWPSNLLPMAGTYLVASQLGMDLSFWQIVAVQTVTYFLSVLPVSVNGYGLREVTYTTLYPALGATLEQAATLALVTRFLMILVTVPGVIWVSGVVTDATVNGNELGGVES